MRKLLTALVVVLLGTSLAQASELERTATGYRWERNGIQIPLVSRHGRWSAGEARSVAAALDKLPDAYIKRAIRGGMHRIYRDGARPVAPTDVITGPLDAGAVAVPLSPWNYVSMCDASFGDQEYVDGMTCHELGHCIQWEITKGNLFMTSIWSAYSWASVLPLKVGLRSWNGFVSSYARTNHMEDFADACKWYWYAPDELRLASPGKYLYMRSVVFEGAVSPAAVRKPWERIDRVKPEVYSIAPASGAAGERIEVRGYYFMGAFDGGFNRVAVRGVRALHLPLSRSRMQAWVPAIAHGSASITVTTQDGTSAGLAFTVEKPWWMP